MRSKNIVLFTTHISVLFISVLCRLTSVYVHSSFSILPCDNFFHIRSSLMTLPVSY